MNPLKTAFVFGGAGIAQLVEQLICNSSLANCASFHCFAYRCFR